MGQSRPGEMTYPKKTAEALIREWFAGLPFGKRLSFSLRPDECKEDLHEGIWAEVNAHLGDVREFALQFGPAAWNYGFWPYAARRRRVCWWWINPV